MLLIKYKQVATVDPPKKYAGTYEVLKYPVAAGNLNLGR